MSDKPPRPDPVKEPQTGDIVVVVFWRPDPYPDNPYRGFWDHTTVQIIAAGPRAVCVEVPASTPHGWMRSVADPGFNPCARFVPPDTVFASTADAETFITHYPPPAPK